MENLIIICLLFLIVLLLQNKIVIHKAKEVKPKQIKLSTKLPDIMGQTKPVRNLSMPKNATEGPDKDTQDQTYNFEIEINQDDVFTNTPDLEEEEQEWNRYGISGGDDGFAQGVTLEELSAVGMLLQKNNLKPSQKETAIAIVQKIQGTELFSLLENSMESASRKITQLLDGSLSCENEAGLSTFHKDDLRDFNIGDFV